MKFTKEELRVLWTALQGKYVASSDAYSSVCQKVLKELERMGQ